MLDTGDGRCVFGASPDLQLVVRGREFEPFRSAARGARPVGEAEAAPAFNEESTPPRWRSAATRCATTGAAGGPDRCASIGAGR
jgi:hypothetical protein